ncbi:MAG: betaine/proline/choline family ABC transporter ATP-binding protein [Hyphomicrobiaceae bacterium]|nr:betaine/proline/choline family ABC transporter ATP-binding protein [Hyphomicrobiaceae bacterium]
MTELVKIATRGLYKIFGRNPSRYIELVRDGVGKQELMAKYNHVLALSDMNLDIPANRIFVVMGLSGSGKSVLIRHFNRIVEPTLGSVEIDGRDVLALDQGELRDLRRKHISMVFQRVALMPHRTALENVAYGLSVRGVPATEAHAQAVDWIRRVDMAGYEDYFPAQMSGGMQQRIGIARALATEAEILLMDEPYSALDPLIRTDMQDMLLRLQGELKRTIVFITHDLDEALRLGDGIAILRDGEVVQQGDPQSIVTTPSNDFVGEFVRDIDRGKVIKVGSIMSPLNGARSEVKLTDDTLLEDALVTLAQDGARAARVVDSAGKGVGFVELSDVVAAMRPPDVAEIQPSK